MNSSPEFRPCEDRAARRERLRLLCEADRARLRLVWRAPRARSGPAFTSPVGALAGLLPELLPFMPGRLGGWGRRIFRGAAVVRAMWRAL